MIRPRWFSSTTTFSPATHLASYRTLLREMTVSPIMGTYLTLVNSRRRRPALNQMKIIIRELWQLFSVGTFRLNIDGSLQLDAQGRPLETSHDRRDPGGARRLDRLGLCAASHGQPAGTFNPLAPMVTNESEHMTPDLRRCSPVLLVQSISREGGPQRRISTRRIDNVFNHPNVGPFIGRQLIQHLCY